MAERKKSVLKEIFISHASPDAATAREVRDLLQNVGYATWIAPDDLVGASAWPEQILAAVGRCNALVVLVSGAANKSDHVAREVSIAAEARKPIVPLRLAPIEPSGSLRYLLHLSQWVDVFPAPVANHSDRVRVALEGGGVVRLMRRQSRRSRLLGLVAGVAVVLGAFGWFVNRGDSGNATVGVLAQVPTSINDWSQLDSSLDNLATVEKLVLGDQLQLVRAENAAQSIAFEAPSTWTQVQGTVPFQDGNGGRLGDSLLVSIESTTFDNGRLGALFVGAGPTTPLMASGLDSFQPPAYFDGLGCQSSGLIALDGVIAGQVRLWSDCDNTPRIYVSALLGDGQTSIYVLGRVTTRQEAAVIVETLQSLEIVGTPLA